MCCLDLRGEISGSLRFSGAFSFLGFLEFGGFSVLGLVFVFEFGV